MAELSAQFKKIRTEKGLTQKQVADGIGITEQAYQRYEYGKTVPSALVLISLADFFDISLDYLVGRSDDPARR
ncbi:MAG: helix-turn-helix transcriptional regulator [Clostridia bacterium]|nr:helix-turn-helix transcriptional regulator [Clostridia bacterium]